MKKRIIFLVLSVCAIINLPAQQQFNVQNGTKTEFYTDLETAIQKAVSGDTIYLPGQVIQVQNDLVIDKKLSIIGAGCDVDSIGGLHTTDIQKSDGSYANVNFRDGSDGSLITGCIVNNIQIGYINEFNENIQNMQNITIWRNKTNGSIYLGVSATNNNIKNIFIKENQIIFSGIRGNKASNCWINNNLMNYYGVYDLNNSYIYNNVIGGAIGSLNGCVIENNFIGDTNFNLNDASNPYSNYGIIQNCSFNNNAFASSNISFPNGINGTNTGANNLINQESIKTFQVNYLNFPKNMVVRDTSPCKKAGTDGTDIGIFGGLTPYKAGAVPFNPHIDKAFISSQTDGTGVKLKIDMTVSAQDK